ncbi:hypothetical protein [Glycomyces harbinensis]|uniref:hypothetical protein n=1 Tax=Glycomyces harbinensis TaxID=58114 RepID=UPI000B892D3B|nr:hypothetical protein [Glycomyces harbinensis]
MNPYDDASVFVQARPDATPPPSSVDIKRVMREGYRARRRRRAAVGTAAGAGAAAVAAVLALSLTGTPGTPEQRFPAGDGFDFDPALAGYPGAAVYDDADPAGDALNDAVLDAFGDLAADAGFVDEDDLDYERPSDEAIAEAMAEHDLDYYAALSDLGYRGLPLLFGPWESPGNGGQVYLRGYVAGDADEEADQSSFSITALAPGGWTADPGPTGGAAFPQHLIGDEATWTDRAPDFATETLDDGRTLMTADHGCALEAAVVYPNGSALRSSWDLDCEGQGRDMDLEDLTAAMLAMPQIDHDTSELAPVDDLLDVPAGWAYDAAWETDAAADAQASIEAAAGAIGEVYGDPDLDSAQPTQGETGDGSVRRSYGAGLHMPFSDADGIPVYFSLYYHLPGGWLPGLAPEGTSAEPYLIDCSETDKDDTCEEFEVDGRTVATRTFGIVDSHSYWVVVYDPAGWAVAFETSFTGDIDGFAFEDIVDLAAGLPAPVYDAAAYERD